MEELKKMIEQIIAFVKGILDQIFNTVQPR